jgi:hypothetical protein
MTAERNARFVFRLKAGASSYLIKNIARFTSAYGKKRPLDFSKKFTYDPSKHRFEGIDAEIGNFLLELMEASTGNASAGAYGDTVNRQVFDDKYLFLTDRQFRRFIDIFARNNAPLPVSRNTSAIPAHIVDENVPIAFRLERDGSDFLLKVDADGDLLPLTSSGDIVYRGGAIYRPKKSQTKIIRPFLSLLEAYSERDFRFVSDDRSRFVSEVLPAIDRIGTLTMDGDVSSLIVKRPIAADIYLDRENGLVSADVRFRYGETEINPFAAAAKHSKGDGPIIVRDVAKENEILDILAEADFKVKNGKINLYDDDSVFYFVVDILPKIGRAHV